MKYKRHREVSIPRSGILGDGRGGGEGGDSSNGGEGRRVIHLASILLGCSYS